MSKTLKPRRANVPIELSDEDKGLLEQLVKRSGMHKKQVVARLIRWFAAQSDVVQGSILGTIPESLRVDVARMELDRLAKSKSGKGS